MHARVVDLIMCSAGSIATAPLFSPRFAIALIIVVAWDTLWATSWPTPEYPALSWFRFISTPR